MFKMITLQANKTSLLNIERELDLKVGGIKELTNTKVLEELANAIFTIGSKAFIRAMNLESKGNPQAYHHIYEWNKVGNSSQRLFLLYRQSNVGGKLVIRPGLKQSKSRVPVPSALSTPGRTGKSVASKHVFRDKASIMESGRPIIYRASKSLPMLQGGQLRFVAAGTVIKNFNPGGKQVKGSFEKFFNYWFSNKLNSAINSSGIIQNIDKETAKVLNQKGAGSKEVKAAIINLLQQYSKGETVL